MISLTLVCAAGMSTNMLMQSVNKYIKENNMDITVAAYAESKIDEILKISDVILLGPQISFLEDDILEKAAPLGIPVAVIPIADYGLLNGERVTALALKLLERGCSNGTIF